ncbi:hypothetical protein [Xanthomonas oryzae]|uniref:hypothetical protein n=1 Tax=Xanthomonas oryzae TaxID=347 RepID=UPI001F5F5777|nr:hypothetical protein [Xanthomonas oryzae]
MTLADELKAAGRSLTKPTLGKIIKEIRKNPIPNLVLSQDFLKKLFLLVERRNAYAHRKEADDLGNL